MAESYTDKEIQHRCLVVATASGPTQFHRCLVSLIRDQLDYKDHCSAWYQLVSVILDDLFKTYGLVA